MIKSFCKSICILLLATILFASLCIGGLMSNTQTAFAASSHGGGSSGDNFGTSDSLYGGGFSSDKYSSIERDFSGDDSFNIADYPYIAGDYSLNVIQIAESEGGELFIYVYQPTFLTDRYYATCISMSKEQSADNTVLYNLLFCSNYQTICKYKVADIQLDSYVHYYNISSIYRNWISGVDESPAVGSTFSQKSYGVGQLWRVSYKMLIPDYAVEQTNVVTILNPFVGFLEYNNGFYLWRYEHCRSHFIAFSTDYDIDFLQEAEIYYVSADCSGVPELGDAAVTKTNIHDNYVIVRADNYGSNDPNIFGKTYTWSRIQSHDYFVSSESLSVDSLNSIADTQWVLRFVESTVVREHANEWVITNYTDISDVTILRLKFVAAGKTYNLGAVSDKVTGDLIPDNTNTDEYASGKEVLDNVKNWFDRIADQIGIPVQGLYAILIGVLVLVVFIILTSFLPNIMLPVLKGIFEVLIWIIMLPFKAIAAIIEFFAK